MTAALRTTFATSRLLEFCSQKELTAQTGHEPDDWPLVVVKELVDNALDACEEAGIAPVARVTVARGRIRVRDNGPGIPPETVASILDFATRTSSREAYVAPDRGRQGNALKTVLAMPFALSGEEGRVEIEACGIRHAIAFRVDRIAQTPVIDHQQHRLERASVRTGTSTVVHWPESSWSELADAGVRFLPLLSHFTDFNPHLTICATWVDEDRREQWRDSAAAPSWTKWVPSAPTCPHWYRAEDLERLAGAFLSHDRERKTVRLLRDFLSIFNGLAGTTKRKAVLDAVGLQRALLERLLEKGGEDFDHELVSRLLAAMQEAARPTKPERLGLIGRDNITLSLERYGGDPETIRYKALKGIDGGVPWSVEAAFAYRPEGAFRELLCGVNWSPSLAGDPFRLGPQLAGAYCGASEPIVLLVHFVCPRPEFLDRGKANLAYHSPGYQAVRAAVAEVIEDWTKQRRAEIRNKRHEEHRLEKMRRQQAPAISLKDLVLEHLQSAIENVSHGGTISFTQRDLFYVLRPIVQSAHEKTFKYSYFKGLLDDIELEQDEIKGLQREPRGSLYHPHLRQEIPLWTDSVAHYWRPDWLFNKLLYSEKAGFQKNLVEVGWPEEFDCAILNSQGYTTRAVKDLVDLFASSPEPVTVYCLHDADAAGTMIYHTLQHETKARGARKIEVVNLGLEPWEGVELGLEIEVVERIGKRRPVAPYVVAHDEEWRPWLEARASASWPDWLQRYRIELNAMPPMQRIAWLTEKIARYPPRKVVPPASWLDAARRDAARSAIRTELLERARIDQRTEEMLSTIRWPVPKGRLPQIAQRWLERNRAQRWDHPMERSGRKIAHRALKKGGKR